MIVNKKRIYRRMRENDLLVNRTTRYQAKRKPSRSKPKALVPNHIWRTNITKIKINSWDCYYLVLILDCIPRKSLPTICLYNPKAATSNKPKNRPY